MKIGIIDYGMGNIHSVKRCVNSLDVETHIIQSASELDNVDKIILPGVGHFSSAVQILKDKQLWNPLNECVLNKKKPILGICLGMQLLVSNSEEGNVNGFGWIKGVVKKFDFDTTNYKIPQIGWNSVNFVDNQKLNIGIEPDKDFYFVHSYYLDEVDPECIAGLTNYNVQYVSAIRKDNIVGVQFHPEKSFNQGKQVIKNFLNNT